MAYEITRNKDLCGGKACIRGTRIRIVDIVERYKFLKEQPEEIALKFNLPLQAVFSALSYYYEHLKEMNQELRQDKHFIKNIRATLRMPAYAT